MQIPQLIIPAIIVAFAPTEAPCFTIVLEISKSCFDLGYKSLVKVTLGPICTLSSIVIPSQI